MTVTYLDPSEVKAVRQTEPPRSGNTRSGYGARLPSSWEVQMRGRWYRVRIVCYSNAGSAYVVSKGQRLFLGGFEPLEFKPAPTATALESHG